MNTDRRTFLKLTGLVVVGIAAKPALDIVGGAGRSEAAQVGTPASKAAKAARRWAMIIDATKCKPDCTDCITACNTTHNIPDLGNAKEEIKWIWREHFEAAFPEQAQEYVASPLKGKSLPVLCNHCDNPPCVRVCPTQATWKREDGIVMMDEHRCIGCRFCMAGCPYGSRSFNWRDPRPHIKQISPSYPTRTKGVVEKCTFCAERIDKGLGPACVEACQHQAMYFGDLNDPGSNVRKILEARVSLVRRPNLGTKPQDYYTIG